MSKKRISLLLVGGIVIFLMTFFVQQLLSTTALTEQQMIAQIKKVYDGHVQSLVEKDDNFVASFEKNGSTYEVQINPYNGEFSNMEVIFLAEKNEQHDNPVQENLEETPYKPLLSETEAVSIALKEIQGEIDDIDFKETTDGGNYFIEIEQDNEEEVIVQVHAITGKILSIQFKD